MASKSLSTSTLSLRFMQNAQRAKQLKEVELDRAEVKDDEKWEVSQETRKSWGMSSEFYSGSSEVHESSYLPFLFADTESPINDSSSASVTTKTIGRRVFNRKGEIVAVESSHIGTASPSIPTKATSQASSSSRKIHPRPVSISTTGSSGQLRGFEGLTKPKDGKASKSAREAIFESGGVGTDLKTESRKNPGLIKPTFLKPAGVDEPKAVQTTLSTPVPIKSEEVLIGAREKKSKRERETGEQNEGRKRSKKNKKGPE